MRWAFLLATGAIHVMHRGYLDFGRLKRLHHAGAIFVTGAKNLTGNVFATI
jgi:cbb3-type cytochrome oxidase subunit 1